MQSQHHASSLMQKKFEKHEIAPTKNEGNYLIFSMHEIPSIKRYLKTFPTFPESSLIAKIISPKACATTVLWSGMSGFNVSVQPYCDGSIGFVLDPSKIEVPQADLVAYMSRCKLSNEVNKNKSHDSYYDYYSRNKSNYPNKAGYYRERDNGLKIFTTNLARHEHIPGTKESVYHPQGNVECWANNIWYKFNKPFTPKHQVPKYVANGIMTLNEGLVFQKGDDNPIRGLIITRTPTQETAKELLSIIKENNLLELYFYDKKATVHIIRYLNNTQAQSYLEENLDFNLAFERAQAFRGYSSQTNEDKNNLSSTKLNKNTQTEILSDSKQPQFS